MNRSRKRSESEKQPLTHSQIEQIRKKQRSTHLQQQQQPLPLPTQLQPGTRIIDLNTPGLVPPDFREHKQTAISRFIASKPPNTSTRKPQKREEQLPSIPPRDARVPPTPSEEDAYGVLSMLSGLRNANSGKGDSVPSFIVDQRHREPYKKQLSNKKKMDKGRTLAEQIDRNSPGRSRSSPTRGNMTARDLSELVKTEIPPLPTPEYESEEHKRQYNWGGKTKRKKRRKPKTKRKKLTKKHKHKKRKSTRKK